MHLQLVNVVTGDALGVPLADGHVGKPVQPRKQHDFVAVGATRLRGDRAAVWLVAGCALTMTRRASPKLFLVAASAGEHPSRLVHGALVTPGATGMTQISAGLTHLSHVTAPAQGAIGEAAQVESMWLMTSRTWRVPGMERSLRASLLVTLRALQGDLGDSLGMRLVASDAFLGALCRMGQRDVGMAACTGLLCPEDIVRRVATGAVAVRAR